MDKIRDFYGTDIITVMRDACLSFAVDQEELDIEVLETGSPGIFGLCKKKARIRVQLKKSFSGDLSGDGGESAEMVKKDKKTKNVEGAKSKSKGEENKKAVPPPSEEAKIEQKTVGGDLSEKQVVAEQKKQTGEAGQKKLSQCKKKKQLEEPVPPPSEETLVSLQEDIKHFFDLTGHPMEATLSVEESVLNCTLSGEHEEPLTNDDGRVLNSIQYLLRKMMSRRLPDRMLLCLDVGDFRNRRLEELKEKALQMAVEVRETGKTLMIPALSPAERREIHIILKKDKEIRSRSVGDGLFKKVLIYKPGKSARPSSPKQKNKEDRPNGQPEKD